MMKWPKLRCWQTLTLVLASCGVSFVLAYPLDGYEESGIRRVEFGRLVQASLAEGDKQPPGALLTTPEVDLRLLDHRNLDLPEPDPGFTAEIVSLLGAEAPKYSLAVLDLTDPGAPVYAEFHGDHRQNVGSVGKLLAALGLFQALADAWPQDSDQRQRILRDTLVTADDFSISDHHTIRIFEVENRTLIRRPMAVGDQGSLWEFLDWMLSVSSNSAASIVMRDAMLLKQFGRAYPVSEEAIDRFFEETPRPEMTLLFQETFWEPVARAGLDLGQIRQGSFFTAQGHRKVSGGGDSYATARSLMELVLRMEEGRLVDEWSSRQIKRLLYSTERRIRYASAPELRDAAVYFKSGSLFKCEPEEGFKCYPYHGNVINYMNSVAIVEESVGGADLHYIVILISNVLRVNSAVAHQTLGNKMHQLIRERHAAPSLQPEP